MVLCNCNGKDASNSNGNRSGNNNNNFNSSSNDNDTIDSDCDDDNNNTDNNSTTNQHNDKIYHNYNSGCSNINDNKHNALYHIKAINNANAFISLPLILLLRL